MIITKKHLSRRTLLRGAGVSIALPFLDAMLLAQSSVRSSVAAPPSRFTFIYLPHGMIMDELTPPRRKGKKFKLTSILEPLAPYRNHLTVVSGLQSAPAGDGSAGDHMPLSSRLPQRKPATEERRPERPPGHDGGSVDRPEDWTRDSATIAGTGNRRRGVRRYLR